ncbi:protein FAM117B-like isoform X2 [Atheta coriaria]|uniref:protein FAM117B-like isoform X2 n=1 Tax=Dalotia coriaria TaxID=877792 RepID=UPI0031F43B47
MSAGGASGGGRLKSSPKSPSTIKHHGPMKATLPMASLLKQSSPLRSSVSPTFSTGLGWKPSEVHSGLRSPGSTISKGKVRTKTGTLNCIRRSASLDAIYLQGQWPRENLYVPQLLQVDKATQTEENEWFECRKVLLMGSSGEENANNSNTNGNDKLEKYIKHKIQRGAAGSGGPAHGLSGNRSQTSPTGGFAPVVGDHTLNTSSQTNTSCLMPIPRALPVNIPIKPLSKPTMRNSVEGLNQEIERLVLKSDGLACSTSDKHDEFDKTTPEGHRAPFPELYRSTRSVNTQTPSANDLRGSCHSSSGSRGSSPDQEYSTKLGTSPRIFLARGPPDGCERVSMRPEGSMTLLPPSEHHVLLPQPCTAFRLQPSQGSAFQLLQPAAAAIMPADPQPDLI